MPNTEQIFSGSDMVLTTHQKGGVMSGGFLISTATANTDSSSNKKGGGLISTLKDLAVPAGLFYAASNIEKLMVDEKDAGVIKDSTYDELIRDVEQSNKKKKASKKSTTRRKRKSSTKKFEERNFFANSSAILSFSLPKLSVNTFKPLNVFISLM